MSYTHRGLSDVVTTVLIILLVVVAVVAIGAYVRTSVDQTGKTVERESTCLVNRLDVTSCKFVGTSLTLNYKRTTDDQALALVANPALAVKATTGIISNPILTTTIPTSNGGIASGTATVVGIPAEATLTFELTLKNGNKITCSGATLACSA